MCVAIPALIVELTPGAMSMGRVKQADRVVDCCLAYVPEAQVGDYVLVQRGFAMQLLDEQSAQESIDAFEQLGLGAYA